MLDCLISRRSSVHSELGIQYCLGEKSHSYCTEVKFDQSKHFCVKTLDRRVLTRQNKFKGRVRKPMALESKLKRAKKGQRGTMTGKL